MSRIPRRLPAGAPQVSLSPQEDHLLGVVDATLSEDDLAFVTGMDPDEVSSTLDRLVDMGLVVFASDDDEREEDEGSAAGGTDDDANGADDEASPDSDATAAGDSETAASEEPDPGDGIDLSHTMREGIDLLFEQLEFLNHYDVLSVERDAGVADIRGAYLKMAPKFHPDRYFRKSLGPFKQKIEAIFGALPKAHDTLRNPARRKAYDAKHPVGKAAQARRNRPPVAPTPAPSPSIVPPPAPSVECEPIEPPPTPAMPSEALKPPRVPRVAARQSRPGSGAQPRRDVEASPPPRPVQRRRGARSRPGGKRPSSPPQSDEQRQAQRDALVRKLRRGSAPPPPTQTATRLAQRTSRIDTGDAAQNVQQSAAEKLRGRFSKIGDEARQRRLKRYLSHGEQAMHAADYRVAVEAFRQALRLSPRDTDIADKLNEAERQASTE